MKVIKEGLTPVLNSKLITDFTTSFAIELTVETEDIDGLGHMNNAIYVNWLDQAHLLHTFSLGVTPEVMQSTSCGLVVRHSNLLYLLGLKENDTVLVGTQIKICDGKIRLFRQFQMVELKSKQTALRGTIEYICVDFARAKPRRMPVEFSSALVL